MLTSNGTVHDIINNSKVRNAQLPSLEIVIYYGNFQQHLWTVYNKARIQRMPDNTIAWCTYILIYLCIWDVLYIQNVYRNTSATKGFFIHNLFIYHCQFINVDQETLRLFYFRLRNLLLLLPYKLSVKIRVIYQWKTELIACINLGLDIYTFSSQFIK